MGQTGDGAGLAIETLAELRRGGEMGGKDFDGDITIETAVACAIDLTHASGAEGRQDFVGSEAGTVREWQSVKYRDGPALQRSPCRAARGSRSDG